ncbi:MAG: hypothetical protein WDN46_16655 [Methylocella sp.]
MRQRKGHFPAAGAGEIGREVRDALGDQVVDHVALALDASAQGHHARRQDSARLASNTFVRATKLEMHVSSSRVMKSTPSGIVFKDEWRSQILPADVAGERSIDDMPPEAAIREGGQ